MAGAYDVVVSASSWDDAGVQHTHRSIFMRLPRPAAAGTRNDTPLLIQRKIARARFIAAQLATIPFIRLIALGNSVAMGTATEMSDLDFFIVTAPNRLWTARFLLLIKAKWLGLSKRPGKTADQADFGFWVDETALDLSSIALPKSPPTPLSKRGEFPPLQRGMKGDFDDPYLSRWLSSLIPLVDRGGVYDRLVAANQQLVQQGAVISNTVRDPVVTHIRSGFLALLEMTLDSWLGQPIEHLLLMLQHWKVWADPITHHPSPITKNGKRIDIVTTRHMLKLHHFDQRAKYRSNVQDNKPGL